MDYKEKLLPIRCYLFSVWIMSLKCIRMLNVAVKVNTNTRAYRNQNIHTKNLTFGILFAISIEKVLNSHQFIQGFNAQNSSRGHDGKIVWECIRILQYRHRCKTRGRQQGILIPNVRIMYPTETQRYHAIQK